MFSRVEKNILLTWGNVGPLHEKIMKFFFKIKKLQHILNFARERKFHFSDKDIFPMKIFFSRWMSLESVAETVILIELRKIFF